MPVVDAPSQEQRLGISILVYTPAALGTPAFVERVDTKLKAYGHEINAVGGYLNATLTILSELRDLELWMENGLGRHVEVYNSYGAQIWEGFVNTISLTSGGFNIERGPLVDVVNRCSVEYTPIIDPLPEPPIMVTKTESTIAEDATSQAFKIFSTTSACGNTGRPCPMITNSGLQTCFFTHMKSWRLMTGLSSWFEPSGKGSAFRAHCGASSSWEGISGGSSTFMITGKGIGKNPLQKF